MSQDLLRDQGRDIRAKVSICWRHEDDHSLRSSVADYTKWRQVYDAFTPTQKTLGVQDQAVYQAIDNPNDITVRHEFATLEAAQAFGGSPELREAMHDAGVEGAPTIWFTTRS